MADSDFALSASLAEVIAALEKAPFGARGFDEQIWLALGGKLLPVRERGGHQHTRWIAPDGSRRTQETTQFTVSVEDAVSLVPDGREWSVGIDLENSRAWAVVGDDVWDESCNDITANGSSPALALCIAALKARHQRALQGAKPNER